MTMDKNVAYSVWFYIGFLTVVHTALIIYWLVSGLPFFSTMALLKFVIASLSMNMVVVLGINIVTHLRLRKPVESKDLELRMEFLRGLLAALFSFAIGSLLIVSADQAVDSNSVGIAGMLTIIAVVFVSSIYLGVLVVEKLLL